MPPVTSLNKLFPTISAKSLAGTLVTLPIKTHGNVALVALAFQRPAQEMLNSWMVPFYKEFDDDPGYVRYEMSMIDAHFARTTGVTTDAGMPNGVPPSRHPFVMTFYGDLNEYIRFFGITDRSLGYVFLLDKQGIIRWIGKGYALPDHAKTLIATARKLHDAPD